MTGRSTMSAIAGRLAIAVAIFGACVDPNAQSPGAQTPRPAAADQPIVMEESTAATSAPAAAPAAQPAPAPAASGGYSLPETPVPVAYRPHDGKTGNVYTDRFVA